MKKLIVFLYCAALGGFGLAESVTNNLNLLGGVVTNHGFVALVDTNSYLLTNVAVRSSWGIEPVRLVLFLDLSAVRT